MRQPHDSGRTQAACLASPAHVAELVHLFRRLPERFTGHSLHVMPCCSLGHTHTSKSRWKFRLLPLYQPVLPDSEAGFSGD